MLTTTTSPTPDNLDLSPEPHPLVDGAIVMTDRYRVEFLPDYEPPDIHRREITAATWKNAHGALVNVGEDDGLILRLEANGVLIQRGGIWAGSWMSSRPKRS